MNIYDKIFTYINSKNDFNQLDPEILEQYKNSLIFIGDQKQIYQPLTNTYIGVGKDEFDRLENAINQSGNNLTAFNSYIHKDVVTHIYGQYSEEDLQTFYNLSTNDGAERILVDNNNYSNRISISNYSYLSSTNRNILIKGLYDYDPANPYGNTYLDVNVKTNNGVNNIYATYYNKSANSYGTSGINVQIKHTGAWKKADPSPEYPYGFSYWDGQDILTIDDKLTWSYIGQNISYLKNYARTIAAEEANRIYHNLLGSDVVFISKNLDNILHYNGGNDPNNVDLNNVYVKVVDDQVPAGYSFELVTVTGPDANGIYELSLGGVTLATYDPEIGNVGISNTVETDLNPIKLFENDGWVRDTSNQVIDIIWYTEDPAQTSPFNYDLSDGIQTIKEVAYILDSITDGNDAGISIAYNIKQNHTDIENLQNWQNTVNNPTTSSFVTSFNSSSNINTNFLSIYSYSTSQSIETKGDIQLYGAVILAYTYTIDGISYAAYTAGQIPNNQYTRYTEYGNLDDPDNYVSVTDSTNGDNTKRVNIANILHKLGNPTSSQIRLYIKENGKYVTTTSFVTLSDLLDDSNSATDITVDNNTSYIFFPYLAHTVELDPNTGVLDGITTVNWVTTYVGHGLNDLSNRLNEGNEGANRYTDEQIGYLDYTDTPTQGTYVYAVNEVDGKISVLRGSFPQDIIYTNPIVANEDDFIKIPYELAHEYAQANTPTIYCVNSGLYVDVLANSLEMNPLTQYYIKTALPTNRFKLATGLDSNPVELTDLIGSGYNFFKLVTSDQKNIYVPVDLQEEIRTIIDNDTSGTPDLTLVTTPLYYIDFNITPSRFAKYIDGSTSIGPDGHTNINVNAYISYLSTSHDSYNTGLADAYDVRRTIERMFTWIDLKTNADFVRATA